MKTEIQKLRFKLTILTLLIGLIAFAQPEQMAAKSTKSTKSVKPVKSVEKIKRVKVDDETLTGSEKSIEISYPIDFRPKVNVELYDTETEFLPARENNIEIKLEYVAEGKNTEDLRKLHEAIEDNLISVIGNTVDISMKFYKSYRSIVVGPGISNVTIELKNNTKIKLSKFKITNLQIFLPADMDLDLEAKYCPVDIVFSINGDVEMKGYDAEIQGKRISCNFELNAKYSRAEFEAVTGSSNIKLYESKLWLNSLNDAKIESKYSHINLDNLTSLVVTGYEDDYDITNVPNADFTVKYTDIELDKAKIVKANLYEGGIELREANTLKLRAKYAECDFGNIETVELIEGYENELEFNQVKKFSSIEGKYNEFYIENLSESVKVSGYEDEIDIEAIGVDFTTVEISGKYQDIDLIAPKKAMYKLHGNISYPDLNMDEDEFKKVLYDKSGSKLQFEYHHGKATSFTKEIKLEGYEIDLSLNHQ